MPAVRNGIRNAFALLATLALPLAALAGERPIISDVIVRGNQLIPAAQIKSMLKARPGRPFVLEELQEDVRTLYATRQFASVCAEKQSDGPDQVKVFFLVRDYLGTVQRVTYQGAGHLKKEDLDAVTGARVGLPLSPAANKMACEKIVAKYREEGRPFATCALRKGGNATDTEVVFDVTEGPQVKVREVGFTGNHFVSAALLRTHVNTSSGLLGLGLVGGPYNPALIEADADTLLKYYRSLGFHDARVAREVRYVAAGHDLFVLFHVYEGARYRLQSAPQVRGVRCVPPERLAALAKVKAGDFYDQRKIDLDLAVLKDYLGYLGRDVRVQALPVYGREPGAITALLYEVGPANPVAKPASARGQAPD